MKFAFAALVASTVWMVPVSADAATCAQRASEVARETGGRVVAVTAVGNRCRIRLVVKDGNGPPVSRVITVRR